MKRLYMTAYRYRQNLGEADLRELTKKFAELGTVPGVIAHYERLDGMGGFMIEDLSHEDAERSYELASATPRGWSWKSSRSPRSKRRSR